MTVPIAGRGHQVLGVASLFLALSTITIALRCYCRALVVKSLGPDDICAVIAWIFFAIFCSFAISGVYHGTGQHASTLPITEIPIGLKLWWVCEPVYVLSNMALKLSIAIFLLRIAVARTHRAIIWTVVLMLEIYSAFYFFLFVLQCRPSAYFWTRYTGGKGTCINPRLTIDATYAYSAISCVVDWTLGVIPVFLVWNLHINARTKVVVAMILAVGAIASTATIIRIPYIKNLANQADFLYATTDIALWSTAETGIGITASACATLRPLFRNFFSRTHPTHGSTIAPGSGNRIPKSSSRYNKHKYAYFHGEEGGGRGTARSFELRSDLARNTGVTTVIGGAHSDLEDGMGNGRWNNSFSRLTGISSDEEREYGKQPQLWEGGITKTTVSTQVADTS